MNRAVEHAANALEMVMEASQGEKAVIFCDDVRRDVGEMFALAALHRGLYTRLIVFETNGPRKEVPSLAKEIIASNWADITLNFLRGDAEETPFRIQLTKLETRNRKRLGHCPGTTMDMLLNGALALSRAEYQKMQGTAEKLMSVMTGAREVHIVNSAGTDISLSVEGRDFFTDTKVDWRRLKWMNLPVGEVLAGPREHEGGGTIVCDVAIGGIGPIRSPLTLKVEDGRCVRVTCRNRKVLERVRRTLDTDEMSSRLGEFAFGLNPRARNVEEFIETEKLGGTVHIALGSNVDFPGGRNTGGNHMDFLISRPTVTVTYEGETRTVMKNGKFTV